MSRCGRCESELEPDAKIHTCPDCGTSFHYECHNLDSGICPVCTICGITPTLALERKQVELSFQQKGIRPEGEPQLLQATAGTAAVNEQFDNAPIEQQVELINKAIKAKPRKLVSSRGTARNKVALLGVLGAIMIKMLLTGFESGQWLPFLLTGIVAAGVGLWWVTT